LPDGQGAEVTASFVAEATGRRAAVGTAADEGARRLYLDRLVALPLDLRRERPSDRVLRLAPSPSGWWYTIGGSGVQDVAVYLTDGDLLPRQPDALAHHLERECSAAEAFIGAVSTRRITPVQRLLRDARTGCRRVLWRGQWLPVGDSAFTLDPLSGSGLARGLQMADRAASAIDVYLATGELRELRELALSFCGEFAMAQTVHRRLYAKCAQRFPDSEFWRRRGRPPGWPNNRVVSPE
jgi:flavin-dependent dehydrogenase